MYICNIDAMYAKKNRLVSTFGAVRTGEQLREERSKALNNTSYFSSVVR